MRTYRQWILPVPRAYLGFPLVSFPFKMQMKENSGSYLSLRTLPRTIMRIVRTRLLLTSQQLLSLSWISHYSLLSLSTSNGILSNMSHIIYFLLLLWHTCRYEASRLRLCQSPSPTVERDIWAPAAVKSKAQRNISILERNCGNRIFDPMFHSDKVGTTKYNIATSFSFVMLPLPLAVRAKLNF